MVPKQGDDMEEDNEDFVWPLHRDTPVRDENIVSCNLNTRFIMLTSNEHISVDDAIEDIRSRIEA
jgi:hypothetical protein